MKYFNTETIAKIRRGYYSAVYFNRTKEILLKEKILKRVTIQVFQKKKGSILCGVEEVLELLKLGTGYWENENPNDKIQMTNQVPAFAEASAGRQNSKFKNLKWIDKSGSLEFKLLKDGDRLEAWETAMHISGPYAYFANLESIYLGILARRTWIATNTRKCAEAAKGKPIIFFGDRFDYFLNQEGDGYAAKIGGASGVCTEAHSVLIGGEPVGTIPHALIALTNGKIEEAAELFYKYYPKVNLIALVDFNNDCVNESIAVARKMGNKLWGVRLDTASDLVDKSLQHGHSDQAKRVEESSDYTGGRSLDFPSHLLRVNARDDIKGVNPELVRLVRKALDREGFNKVKIVVSGGFYPGKIRQFSDEKVPVDAYGVGSAIVHGDNDFTADVVEVEGKPIAKAGREYRALVISSETK